MICIDLFCGLGGWTDGFLAEGYECIGFDIERHDYGSGGYPGQLVLQDILTVHGSQFRAATCIVASPPCQKYSYMAMPWKRAKALIAWHRENPERVKALNALFDACFRIQYEACEAAGRHIPLVIENVKGAQPWVGRAKANYGSFYLWGDVESLGVRIVASGQPLSFGMPSVRAAGRRMKSRVDCAPRRFDERIATTPEEAHAQNPDGRKVPGIKLSKVGFNVAAAQRYREERDGVKQGGEWWHDINGIQKFSSKSDSRKAASAQIAKIPFPLAQYIARIYKPLA